MPPRSPSGKVTYFCSACIYKRLLFINLSILPRWHLNFLLGKLYNSNCWYLKNPKTFRLITTKKNRWENTNLHFKKGTTQVHTTKLYKVTLSKFSLLQRSRQRTRSWGFCFTPFVALTLFSTAFTHPCRERSVYTQWCLTFPGSHSIIRKLDTSIKKVKRGHLPSDYKIPLLEEDTIVFEDMLWKNHIKMKRAPFQQH